MSLDAKIRLSIAQRKLNPVATISSALDQQQITVVSKKQIDHAVDRVSDGHHTLMRSFKRIAQPSYLDQAIEYVRSLVDKSHHVVPIDQIMRQQQSNVSHLGSLLEQLSATYRSRLSQMNDEFLDGQKRLRTYHARKQELESSIPLLVENQQGYLKKAELDQHPTASEAQGEAFLLDGQLIEAKTAYLRTEHALEAETTRLACTKYQRNILQILVGKADIMAHQTAEYHRSLIRNIGSWKDIHEIAQVVNVMHEQMTIIDSYNNMITESYHDLSRQINDLSNTHHASPDHNVTELRGLFGDLNTADVTRP